MTEKRNPFDFFDFTESDVDEAQDEIAKNVGTKDGRVCICGHPAGRHSPGGIDALTRVEIELCTGNKGNQCQCRKLRVVLKAENARVFLRKTVGSGELHALSQGVRDALMPKTKTYMRYNPATGEKEATDVEVPAQTIEWLVAQKCDLCDKEGPVAPCCVNDADKVVDIDVKAFPPTKYTSKFLCKECRLDG